MTECVIHWFRRDLRLADNRALEAALRTGVPVIPVFVLDSRILAQPTMGEKRLQFLRTALDDLDIELRHRGSRLVVRHADDAARELNRLAEESGAWGLFFNRDYSPYARWRDTRATRGMQMTGLVTMPSDDHLLVPPLATVGEDELLPTDFGDFSRRWFGSLEVDPPAEAPPEGVFVAAPDAPAGEEHWREMLAPGLPTPAAWPGATPARARDRLRGFTSGSLHAYAAHPANLDDAEGTSRLSAALKFGTISPRQVAAAAIAVGARDPAAQPSVERFLEAIAWREFAHHLLFNRPHLLQEPLRPGSGQAARDPVADGYDAWVSGRTGLPLVDAGMRQLHREAWMPDPVRAAAASFLALELGASWRAGERHFARHLVDFDVAVNDLGWQRAAGVGVVVDVSPGALGPLPESHHLDAWRDGRRLDPEGAYVRRWLPELAAVPVEYVHCPWEMPAAVQAAAGCRLGVDYPRPVTPPPA